MTTRRIGNGAAIYRHRKDLGNVADHDLGLYTPVYRGFRLSCTGDEIPALQRQVDDFWAKDYQTATDPASKIVVLMTERQQRSEPRPWPLDAACSLPVRGASQRLGTASSSPKEWP